MYHYTQAALETHAMSPTLSGGAQGFGGGLIDSEGSQTLDQSSIHAAHASDTLPWCKDHSANCWVDINGV
ncbi:hypothetical protein AJ80_05487 [Polytolypa hystricis UAMH7299]|uniref:Uncharacterized protein n=1 Tax=Polytolypa hystricis (strain UAMH7299) TaxID=1447883 RepID=A0A2B7Y453_POLH7|nr:hypothetical protein AJ80_05487 [Polytolypa hystricis UAMH7299]